MTSWLHPLTGALDAGAEDDDDTWTNHQCLDCGAAIPWDAAWVEHFHQTARGYREDVSLTVWRCPACGRVGNDAEVA